MFILCIVVDNAPVSCSVDAEWIATKKDWEQNERKYKAHEKERSSLNESRKDSVSSEGSHDTGEGPSTTYDESMDEMRCILYAHGGKSFVHRMESSC